MLKNVSAVYPRELMRRFYGAHDRMQLVQLSVSLLRPRIRRFTTIISAWYGWNKQQIKWEK